MNANVAVRSAKVVYLFAKSINPYRHKNMSKCGKEAQGKICHLDSFHQGCHIDSSGFKFIDDRWPNQMGNGPSGYPMNNPAFDEAVQKVLDDRKEDMEQAERFLKAMSRISS
jgi:hypothetical protein